MSARKTMRILGNHDYARVVEFVRESNSIEAIQTVSSTEVQAHVNLMESATLTVADLTELVSILQPDARLRDQQGLDVMVGKHVPPPGGLQIPQQLERLLNYVNIGASLPWIAHCRYENLHPFTDGNGRSGRALWLWMMIRRGYRLSRLFLHEFYYQSLQHYHEAAR